MKIHTSNVVKRIIAVCVCILMLTGCSVKKEYPPELSPSAATPPPVQTNGTGVLSVTLYYRSADGQLSAEQRDVNWPSGVSRAQVALQALFDDPDSAALSPVMPKGVSFAGVELSGNVCDVYLKGALTDDGQSLLIARAAIAATVEANEGIEYTDVFINGMQPGFNGRPLGVLKPIDGSLNAYLSQYMAADTNAGAEVGTLESRDAQLYFSDTSGNLLLSDVSTMRYDLHAQADLVISALLSELMKGPLESEGREPILPTDMKLAKCSFVGRDAAGSSADTAGSPGIAELHFTKSSEQFDQRLVYAAIVCTVTSFWPGVEGVRIFLDETLVYPDEALGLHTQRSVFERGDFDGVLGHTAVLAFPDQEGLGLYPVLRCMDQDTVYDPKERLQALFTGTADLGVSLTMFSPDDLLSVTIEGDMAVVNWRKGFGDTLADFVNNGVSHLPKSARARMVVYAMINTLCNMPGVQRVWMLEEGQRIDKTIDNIYLGNALLYNPGLMLT